MFQVTIQAAAHRCGEEQISVFKFGPPTLVTTELIFLDITRQSFQESMRLVFGREMQPE